MSKSTLNQLNQESSLDKDGKSSIAYNNDQNNDNLDQILISQFEIQKFVEEKKEFYIYIMNFIENSDENEINFQNLIDYIRIQKHIENRENFEQFLQLIESIANNHHRDNSFFKKIFQILHYYKGTIKQTFSNSEIFDLFQNNKLILLFLFENEIIIFNEDIKNEIISKFDSNGNSYSYFFYPEIKKLSYDEKTKEIENELLSKNSMIFDRFKTNRHEGENDSYICSLIRSDSVEEFIAYVNRSNFHLNNEISHSIFETNSFLNENHHITLIEYCAFFGSIQIFQYLLMSNVQLTPSLWLYAIHSQNGELIHLLEYHNVEPPETVKSKLNKSNKKYENCFIESIKCHHNDIANYIENNLMQQNNDDLNNGMRIKSEFFSNILKYHNYHFLPIEFESSDEFFYLCYYKYNKLVNLYIKNKKKYFNKMIIDDILNLIIK